MSPENPETNSVILTEISASGVATVRIDNPARRNALNPQGWIDLGKAFDELGEREDVRVIVLHGTDGGLCAGLDLKSLSLTPEGKADVSEELVREIFGAITSIRSRRQPVIAVNDGAAVGAAVSLYSAADFRFASPRAMFSAPFATLGLVAGDLGLSWLLPRIIGPTRAATMLMTGQQISGETANEWGMLTALVDDPLEQALALAEQLTTASRFAVEGTKRLLVDSLDTGRSFEEHLEAEILDQTTAMQSADFVEGVTAVLEKRAPKFS